MDKLGFMVRMGRTAGTDDYVHRYLSRDGLPGVEGAFLMSSFWLVDALLMVDRTHEARVLFERLLARANDVGLYAEEVDIANGSFLGNFPQAFTTSHSSTARFICCFTKRGGAAMVNPGRITPEAKASLILRSRHHPSALDLNMPAVRTPTQPPES